MTREDIIRMFHEAGESAGWRPGVGNPLVINYLTHFAALVAAAEREDCACIAERAGYRSNGTPAYEHIAAAIRARSST